MINYNFKTERYCFECHRMKELEAFSKTTKKLYTIKVAGKCNNCRSNPKKTIKFFNKSYEKKEIKP